MKTKLLNVVYKDITKFNSYISYIHNVYIQLIAYTEILLVQTSLMNENPVSHLHIESVTSQNEFGSALEHSTSVVQVHDGF